MIGLSRPTKTALARMVSGMFVGKATFMFDVLITSMLPTFENNRSWDYFQFWI